MLNKKSGTEITKSSSQSTSSLIALDSGEKIKPIRGFESLYVLSSHGRIFSLRRGKWMRLGYTTALKYPQVTLQKEHKRHLYMVHRLVAQHFLPSSDKPNVNHIDSDPTNNHASNLEWCTQSENIVHSIRLGRGQSGTRHHSSKLTRAQVYSIRSAHSNGVSIRKLAEKYGMSFTSMQKVTSGKSYARY